MAAILELDLAQISQLDETVLQQQISNSNGHVLLTFVLADTYSSSFKSELALSWLKAWYIAERLAESASKIDHNVVESDEGRAAFTFNIDVRDGKSLGTTIADLAPAFDPDNLEAEAELGAAAESWLEQRKTAGTQFPDLEKAYRDDAEAESIDDD